MRDEKNRLVKLCPNCNRSVIRIANKQCWQCREKEWEDIRYRNVGLNKIRTLIYT